MERICQKCHKTCSSWQSLWNHKKYCKGGTKHHSFQSQDSIVGHQNTCSVPYKPEAVMGTGVKRQYGAGKVHNQQHNKTLIDSIVDEEHLPKKKEKDFVN